MIRRHTTLWRANRLTLSSPTAPTWGSRQLSITATGDYFTKTRSTNGLALVNQGVVLSGLTNLIKPRLSFGQSRRGFIKFVRPDGKIDLALKQEQDIRDQHTTRVVDYLKAHDGFASAHDKTDPAKIQALFGMSKKSFKKVIGGLYKQRIIKFQPDGIRLNNHDNKPKTNGT